MTRGFYYRFAVLFLFMVSFAVLIAFVAVLPSYFLSSAKSRIADMKLVAQKNEPVPIPDQETLAIIKDLDAKLNLLEQDEQNKFVVSEQVVNAVILRKLPGIKIANIVYENDVAKGKKIIIQGNASSREVLLAFRRALENDVAFKTVDLPISNFVKGSNIKFYLSLIPS